MLWVDQNADDPQAPAEYELQSFYGQLQQVFTIAFKTPLNAPPGFDIPSSTIALASILPANITRRHPALDIHYYKTTGTVETVDLSSVACLVGRVHWKAANERGNGEWAIIDRSGPLLRTLPDDEDSDGEEEEE